MHETAVNYAEARKYSVGQTSPGLTGRGRQGVRPRMARQIGVRLLVGLFALGGSAVLGAQNRVISTDAAITAVVVALGAETRLVGVDVTSELPDSVADLPRLGYHRALSAEGLLSLNPDLILASEHAGPGSVLASVDSAGVRLIKLPAADAFEDLIDNIRRISIALELDANGDRLTQSAQQQRGHLAAQALSAPDTLLLREGEGGLRVAGSGTAGGGLISLLGGHNLAQFEGYRSFSVEALLALNPSLLLIAMPKAESAGAIQRWLRRYPLLLYSEAFARGQLRIVSSEALIGGVSLAALEEAATILEELGAEQLAVP